MFTPLRKFFDKLILLLNIKSDCSKGTSCCLVSSTCCNPKKIIVRCNSCKKKFIPTECPDCL